MVCEVEPPIDRKQSTKQPGPELGPEHQFTGCVVYGGVTSSKQRTGDGRRRGVVAGKGSQIRWWLRVCFFCSLRFAPILKTANIRVSWRLREVCDASVSIFFFKFQTVRFRPTNKTNSALMQRPVFVFKFLFGIERCPNPPEWLFQYF